MKDAVTMAKIEAQKQSEERRSYSYKGYRPYGAAELFILDQNVDDYFNKNVTEYLIGKGAEFEIVNNEKAILHFDRLDIDYKTDE